MAATILTAAAVGLIFSAAGLDRATLWDPEAMAWLLVWASPVAVSAVPLLVRRAGVARAMRIVVAVLLWLSSAVTFTPFFVPAAWVMVVAACRTGAAITRPAQPAERR